MSGQFLSVVTDQLGFYVYMLDTLEEPRAEEEQVECFTKLDLGNKYGNPQYCCWSSDGKYLAVSSESGCVV